MQIYLPIAEVSVNAFLLLGLGGLVGRAVGHVSGSAAGFLITPLFVSFSSVIPPGRGGGDLGPTQISSPRHFLGTLLAHLKRKTVDIKMGVVLLLGGLGRGGGRGAGPLSCLLRMGQVDLLVRLCLTSFSSPPPSGRLMLAESPARPAARARERRHGAEGAQAKTHLDRPPLCRSRCGSAPRVSTSPVIPALWSGCSWGLLDRGHGGGRRLHHGAGDDLPAGNADQGGGFGTSLFQIIFVTGLSPRLMHAVTSYSVDMIPGDSAAGRAG